MDRVILHSDINSCYASIEHAEHPEFRDVPLAVGGSEEARHGIILAKDERCKKCGVKTGMAIWQARALCPEIVVLHPRMDLYLEYSRRAREIYGEYTNLRESFGIDENWLDLTGCLGVTDGEAQAREINRRIRRELGVTVSVGVSWNKIFAKLGSDYKKPDAVTVISRENYRDLVWPLPVEDLLYVGRATSAKLRSCGICTIGALAAADPEHLRARFGKAGYILHSFANGLDASPVRREDGAPPIKSVGNSTTAPRDLVCDEDVRITLMALSESVGMRLRRAGFKCRRVSLGVRGTDLFWRGHQMKTALPTDITDEIFRSGLELFRQMRVWPAPIRSMGISCSDLVPASVPEQTDLFGVSDRRLRQERIDAGMDRIRGKYGFSSIRRGLVCTEAPLGFLNAGDEHAVHPVGFFGGH